MSLFLLSSQDFRSFCRIVSDRYIILSVNEDGIAVALELARVLDRISSAHNWWPRRSLIFCVSLVPSDICLQALPTFIWQKVVAYTTVHGRFVRGLLEFLIFPYDIVRVLYHFNETFHFLLLFTSLY